MEEEKKKRRSKTWRAEKTQRRNKSKSQNPKSQPTPRCQISLPPPSNFELKHGPHGVPPKKPLCITQKASVKPPPHLTPLAAQVKKYRMTARRRRKKTEAEKKKKKSMDYAFQKEKLGLPK